MLKIIFLVTLFCNLLFGISYDMEVSADKLQSELNKKFPYISKNFLMDITIKNTEINLQKDSDRIFVTVNLKVVLYGGYTSEGFAKFNGTIEYKLNEKALFFKDLKVDDIEMNNIKSAYKQTISEVVENVATAVLKKKPIYQIKENDLKKNLVLKFIKTVIVKNERIVLTFEI